MPAYQVEKELAGTVNRIPAELWPQIHRLYILDDGSSDSTGAEIAKLVSQNSKICGVRADQNQGYGATVRRGISLCIADGSETIVCLHSDGQYAPELLPALLQELKDRDLDLLQGSRLAGSGALAGGMPRYKWIAGKLLVLLENAVFQLKMSDYHSGYLIYHRRFLLNSGYEKLQGRFEIDLELIASARARKVRIGEYPIPTRYAGEQSHLNPIPYGLRVLAVLLRYVLGRYDR